MTVTPDFNTNNDQNNKRPGKPQKNTLRESKLDKKAPDDIN